MWSENNTLIREGCCSPYISLSNTDAGSHDTLLPNWPFLKFTFEGFILKDSMKPGFIADELRGTKYMHM